MGLNRRKRWEEDLDFLSLELPKRHKNLFFSKKQEEFYEEMRRLKREIDYYDEYEMQIEAARIIASIRDAHTSLSLRVSKLCPFECYWFSEGIYITSTIAEYKEMEHCKILALNDIQIDQIIQELKSIISHENEAFLKSQLPKFIPAIEVLYGLEIVDGIDVLVVTFENKKGETKKLAIKPLSIQEVREKLRQEGSVIRDKELPLYRKNQNQYYWYEYLHGLKVVYFKYNGCKNMNDSTVFDFTKGLIAFIEKNDVRKLVIDLRNNFGGNSTFLDPFIEWIKRQKEINKKGSLFVIVGRETFSSALINTYSLKENTEAIFIGEASGGKPNCYGEVERVQLKNTGLTISYSTEYYQLSEDEVPSFFPDVTIEETVEEYINREDPCLEYILEKF